jgi:acyl-coenzyme A synthetase/AMP-(fatty) acid ligase
MSQLDVVALRKHIVQFPLTRIVTMPPIIHYFNNLNDPKVFKSLAALRELFVAAAPMGSQLQLEFKEKLHAAGRAAGQDYDCQVVQLWGMTELAAAVTKL